MEWWQFVGIVVAVVVPVGIALHASGRARMDQHIAEDVKAHERIVRVETMVERHADEIDKLRKGQHDFKDEIKKGVWELLEDRFDRFRDEVRRLLRDRE